MPGNHTSLARLLEHAWPGGSSLTLRAQPAAPEQPLAKASSSPVWGTGATEATLHQAMPVSCPLCSSRVLAAAKACHPQPQLGPSAPLSALWTRLRPGLAGSRLPPPTSHLMAWVGMSLADMRGLVCVASGRRLQMMASPPLPLLMCPRTLHLGVLAGSRGDQAPLHPAANKNGLAAPETS